MTQRDEFEEALANATTDSIQELVLRLREQVHEERCKVKRLEAKLAERATAPQTHLIIGDSHCRPGISNRRYTWLGRLICELQPDVVIDIGDWADMESLCKYDEGKAIFEGRRVLEDIECARDARQRVAREIEDYNRGRGDIYAPRLVHCVGNHEARVDRALDSMPQLQGLFSMERLGAEEYGWEVFPYLEPAVIDGIAYSHYHTRGDARYAISGVNAARNLLINGYMSCVAGHSHKFDYSEQLRADHHKVLGLVCGCYLDPEQWENYAGPPSKGSWWKGICVLRDIAGGYGQLEKISIEQIRDRFGG